MKFVEEKIKKVFTKNMGKDIILGRKKRVITDTFMKERDWL